MERQFSGASPEFVANHPCFSKEAHYQFGKIHLPIGSSCNIHCRYCAVGASRHQQPHPTSPERAVQMIAQALKDNPQLAVVGIAGPGEPLASDSTLELLEAVHRHFPQLVKCISTNGLLLYDYAARLAAAGVRTVNVTMNAVRHPILKQLCSYLYYQGQYVTGEHAARMLLSSQIAGIRALIASGVTVRVSTVLIPEVNEDHIEAIAKTAAFLGVAQLNLIPFVPHRNVTFAPPTPLQLYQARQIAALYLPVCEVPQQCGLDTCGAACLESDSGLNS